MAILRKIKDGLKKIMNKEVRVNLGLGAEKKPSRLKKRPMEDIIGKPDSRRPIEESKAKCLGAQETAVETTKYFHPQIERVIRQMPQELSAQYGRDKLVLQVRDPWWIHAYWEVTPQTMDTLKAHLGDLFFSAQMILRVYDVSYIIFDGSNAHRFFDIEITHEANNWYIDTGSSGRSWCVDLGLRFPSGEFITIIRSNTVMTPIEGPSWITDEEWMVPEEIFARLYGMGFGLGRSSPVGRAWQERVRRELFSGVLASPGISSLASPVKKQIPKERKFWLVVNTELIVYGATEPDARVTVQGEPISLRPDGTFSLRFALPDGTQVIPVAATSSDQIETRTITPVVAKKTK